MTHSVRVRKDNDVTIWDWEDMPEMPESGDPPDGWINVGSITFTFHLYQLKKVIVPQV